MSAILKQKLIDIANGFTKYGLWKGGGISNLSELDDVTLTNLQTNDVLTYNGSKWVNDDNLQTQIDTLNSNLNKIGNEIVNISKVKNGIEFDGMYIKVGNVVTISASINIYTDIDNTNQLIDDPIPIPHKRCNLLVVKNGSISTIHSARIANGLIYPDFTMTPGEYSLNGSYICI